MAYEKQTWNCGDTITADKLNHMEDGIANAGGGGGTFFVGATVDGNDLTLDKTLGEIKEAVHDGKQIVVRIVAEVGEGYVVFSQIQFNADGGGELLYFNGKTFVDLTASTDSDYPSTNSPK